MRCNRGYCRPTKRLWLALSDLESLVAPYPLSPSQSSHRVPGQRHSARAAVGAPTLPGYPRSSDCIPGHPSRAPDTRRFSRGWVEIGVGLRGLGLPITRWSIPLPEYPSTSQIIPEWRALEAIPTRSCHPEQARVPVRDEGAKTGSQRVPSRWGVGRRMPDTVSVFVPIQGPIRAR